jgi:hypothetical protein
LSENPLVNEKGVERHFKENIEAAELINDVQKRAALLAAAIEQITSQCDLNTADMQFTLGYAWYMHPGEHLSRADRVITHLQNALQIDPNHKYAKLYLAHHLFDCGEYASTLKLLGEFGPTEFDDVGQGWRDSKTAELILCCQLRLCDAQGVKDAVRQFCESLTRLDAGMNPDPRELTDALHVLLGSGKIV